MKRLSICIPVFNKYSFTEKCLLDLSKLPNDHEIIVVDNGSSDETFKKLNESKEIKYFRLKENKGFAYASNISYGLSEAPNVLFLNNDIAVIKNKENWTNELLKYCDTHIVGPTMGQLDSNFNFIKEANEELTGNSYMSGWCLASSKENWKKLIIPRGQVFSEDFFCYFEDTDLSFRARKLKMPFKVVNIPVIHFGKQTSKQLNTHQLYSNAREIFIKKWKNKV